MGNDNSKRETGGRKRMIRQCSKCTQANMRSETQPIPKKVPLPFFGAINIPVEDYMPYMMRGFRNYTVFICDACGNLL
jgi:hypothetical protein